MKKTNYSEILKKKMEYYNFSPRTIKMYVYYIEQFLENVNKFPTSLTSQDFQNYLDNYTFTSISQQNQVINAISNSMLNKVKLPI